LPASAAAPSSHSSRQSALPRGDARIASIAMRTWVYDQPASSARKLGYLRAGAVVSRARLSAGSDGCKGGWYRVEPRGFVCVGKGASLDIEHPIVQTAFRGPKRGEPMPYRYVVSREPGPHLYFKLASQKAQEHVEGKRRARSLALYAPRQLSQLGPPDPIPPIVASGKPLPKPYGAERTLRRRVHRGRASENSAFGLLGQFDWTDRRMGLTTELDLIPIDRTRIAKLSAMRGVLIEGQGTPAFVIRHAVKSYKPKANGKLIEFEPAAYRSGWVLTGKNNGSPRGLLETAAGVWLPYGSLRIAKLRKDPAGFAKAGRKWIDVSIRRQILVAYEGERAVYATLVSTGRDGMRDPEETHSTVRGAFMIHAKHVSGTMDGDEQTAEPFELHDVPYIQYFYKGFALHGAYWHDSFGKVRSHGCVNLAPTDAAWLFAWTYPHVPASWHGALNHNHGTLVYIHG
jgi:hypothetical protein